MKSILFALALLVGNVAHAQLQRPVTNDNDQLAQIEQANQTVQIDQLDQSLTPSDEAIIESRGGGGFGPHPGGGGFGPHPGGGGFGPHPGGGGFGPRPGGGGFGPHPGGGGFGPHPGGGGFGPRPGFAPGWRFNPGWRPGWLRPGIIFPGFFWIAEASPGYWQCTAYNAEMQPFSDVGPDSNQAAYNALYSCGGPDYQAAGCYIPAGYCQLR